MAELDLARLAPGYPIWPQVARKVDAAHMTAAGASAFLRTPAADDPNCGARAVALVALTAAGLGGPLDMWEAESTCWFRWAFTAAQRVDDVAVPTAPGIL